MNNHCRHFTGLQNETCGAGISYASVVTKAPHTGLASWPCLGGGDCAQFDPYTDEELAEQNSEIEKFLERFVKFRQHETDICPHCGKQVAMLYMVGRCSYGDCGCRLWQGKIPEAWR